MSKLGTLSIPKTQNELRSMLTDRKVMAQLMGDPELLAEFLTESVNARLTNSPDILAQVNEQTEAALIKMLRDYGAKNSELSNLAQRLNLGSPNDVRPIRPGTIYNRAAVGAPHDSLFDTATDFLYAISPHSMKDDKLHNKLITLQNALSSVKPSDGGFLIPETLRAELLRVALETAIVRSRARVIPMDSLTVPWPAIDSSSNVSSVYGGIIGYWTEEGASLTASQPRFGRVNLHAHKLALYTEVPNELIRDSQPAMVAFISDVFPEALAWFEDVAFFVGNGTGEPLGFLNAPAAIAVSRTGSGQQIDWPDIANMYSRMLPQSLSRAVWIVSPDVVPNLLTMPFTVGGTQPVLLGSDGSAFSNAGMTTPFPMQILGRPVIVSEKARAIGTSGDINFVDFGFYLIGDRQAMSARESEDFKFSSDVTAFRVIERIDGRPWLLSPITPQNGSSNTLSAYIKLA